MNKYLIISIIVAVLLVGGFFINTNIAGKATVNNADLEKITLKVSIPCEGHVYFIKSELGKIRGIGEVDYLGQFSFDIHYDSAKISKQDILNLDLFKEYLAKEI